MTTMRVDERSGATAAEVRAVRAASPEVGWRIAVTDTALVVLAVLVSLRFDGALSDAHSPLVVMTSVSSWLTALLACRSRDVHILGSGSREFLRVLAAGVVSIGLIMVTLTVLHTPVPSRLISQTAAATAFVVVGRLAWRIWLVQQRDRGDRLTGVLVVGEEAAEVAQRLAATPAAGLHVAEVRDRVLAPDRIVESALVAEAAGVVLTSHSGLTADQIHDLRWRLEGHGVSLMIDTALIGPDPGRLEFWNVDGYSIVQVTPRGGGAVSRWIKAILDRGCAFVGLVVLAPLLAVVAFLIKAEDGGDVFFRQTRVGEHGAEFRIVKFRTMGTDAEERIGDLHSQNEVDGPLFKMKHDPRVTRVGRILRKYSIDELPQLWNVLVGDMSLVGPRPALPSEVAEYGERSRRRLLARPGITGLWQVSGRSDLTWERGIRLDMAYIDNWSLLNDAVILARTIRAVVRPRGAY